ncbi:MAG TPA: hypothetical protein VLC55_04250 [Burkholderiales bacterium]|nr:hypothetical protein [Burkholderiales bacterium]
MFRLELDPEQRNTLIQALESYVSDLRLEIADTERKDFRDPLKAQEQILKGLLAALRAA